MAAAKSASAGHIIPKVAQLCQSTAEQLTLQQINIHWCTPMRHRASHETLFAERCANKDVESLKDTQAFNQHNPLIWAGSGPACSYNLVIAEGANMTDMIATW